MPAQEVFFNQSLNINSVDLQNAGQSKIKKLFEELEEDKKEAKNKKYLAAQDKRGRPTKHTWKNCKDIAVDFETNCLTFPCIECEKNGNIKKKKHGTIKRWFAKGNDLKSKANGYTKKSFLEFLEKDIYPLRHRSGGKKVMRLWFHNGLKFDIYFFIKNLLKDQEKNNFIHKGAQATWNNIKLYDSYKVFRVGLDKLPMTEKQRETKSWFKRGAIESPEYHQKRWSRPFMKKISDYCENDVDILINNINSLPIKKPTIGAIGMAEIRKDLGEAFKKNLPNWAGKDFDNKREFWHKNFHGAISDVFGRQEIKEEENIDIYSFDKNSMHPDIMKNKPLPCGYGIKNGQRGWVFNVKEEDIKDGSDGTLGAYKVKFRYLIDKKIGKLNLSNLSSKNIKELVLRNEVNLFKKNIPPLIRTEGKNGIVKYVHYVFDKILFFQGQTLKWILEQCYADFHIISGHVLEAKIGLLGNWVDKHYKAKERAKETEGVGSFNYLYHKNILNSVSCKFGQRVHRPHKQLVGVSKKPLINHEHYWKNKNKYYQYVNGNPQRGWTYNYNPYSAVVLGWCNLEMLKKIRKHSDCLLNSDTDSLKLTKFPRDLDIGTGLGQWKEEIRAKSWRTVAAKFYQIDNIIRAKGIKHYIAKRIRWDPRGEEIIIEVWITSINGVTIKPTKYTIRAPKDNQKKVLIDGNWYCVCCHDIQEKSNLFKWTAEELKEKVKEYNLERYYIR